MVDIIFVCYNNKNVIKRCFNSLEKYTENYNNVIVIDNNSDEETIKALLSYKNILKTGDFIFHKNKENLGYSKALNQGIKLSHSPYLVFANLDIEFMENWLPPLIEQLKDGGRLIIPLGSTLYYQTLTLLTKAGKEVRVEHILGVRFVPMVGEAQKRKGK